MVRGEGESSLTSSIGDTRVSELTNSSLTDSGSKILAPIILGYYSDKSGISYSKKPNTRTRLHEIAHKRLGHKTSSKMKVSELINSELEAEAWAWEAMGKKPDYRISYSILSTLIYIYNFPATVAIEEVITAMQDKGIKVSRKDRNSLEVIYGVRKEKT